MCLARSSCAVATLSQAAQGHPATAGRDNQRRPSFGYFPWPRKESDQPPGCPRPLLQIKDDWQIALQIGGPILDAIDLAAFSNVRVGDMHPVPAAASRGGGCDCSARKQQQCCERRQNHLPRGNVDVRQYIASDLPVPLIW